MVKDMKKQSKKLVSIAIAASMLLAGNAALAEGIGVCSAVNNGMDEKTAVAAVNNSRAGWVRDGLAWESFSYTNTDGVYKINPVGLEEMKEYYKELKKNGKKIILILGFGNTSSHLNNSNRFKIPSPANEAYWNGWQEYVKLVAEELKGIVDVYEIWNEQDHKPFNVDADCDCDDNTGTADFMADYVTLLKQSYKDIKSVDSDALVAVGGFAHVGQFLDEFFSAVGSEKCFDVFAGHAYNHGKYSSLESEFRDDLLEYGEYLDKYNYDGDMYLTENGWYTGTDNNALTEKKQAAGLIRNKVLWDDFLKDSGRDGEYFWYCGVDTGMVSDYSESNYGLYTFRLEEKISAKAAKTLNAFTGDKEFVSLDETSSGVITKKYTYKAKYENPENGSLTYVVWGDGTSVNIPGGVVYNADGTLSGEASENISLTDDNPKFVNIDEPGTSIISAEYDSDTGMIKVYGRAYESEGDVEIYANSGDAEEIVTVPQDEYGYFNAEISAPASGDVEVYANYEGYATVTVDGVQTQAVQKSEITSATAVYNGKTNQVTVSASFSGCSENETVKILAAPADVAEINKDNVLYADEFTVSDGENAQFTFMMPSDTQKGKYNVYLRMTNSEKKEDAVYKDMVEVGSFTYGNDGTTITANASGLGYDKGLVENAVIVIAQYDSQNKLISISISDNGIDGNEKTFSVGAEPGAGLVKAMLLKDMATLMPLSSVAIPE